MLRYIADLARRRIGASRKGVLVIFHVYSCYADFFFATSSSGGRGSSSHTCIIIPLHRPHLAGRAKSLALEEVN